MTSVPPPPPPPSTPDQLPWYKASPAPLILGVLGIGAIALAAVMMFGGDDEPTAAGSSTTIVTTTGAITSPPTTTSAGDTTTTKAPGETTTSTVAVTTTVAITTTVAGTTTAGVTTTAATTTTTAAPGLNPGLPPNLGDWSLAAGFTPDPWSINVQSGGSIDVSSVSSSDGAPCFGYATAAPDIQLTWSGSTGGLLRFYFVADNVGDDTTLIINGPDGSWWCADDFAPTRNPLLDFPTGPNGRYDIWVGSYNAGSFYPGKLYVTEVFINTPPY